MLASIIGFELKYQLKSPTFWVSFIIFLLLGFAMLAAPNVSIMAGANVHKNAPLVIVIALTALVTFFMFVTTAFGANVILRDAETAFGPLLYTTRMTKADYVFGRTIGAFIVSALCLLSVPIGILIGSFMPWLDPQTLGPVDMTAYAWAYGLIALPSLLFMVAVFSSAATLTRSMMGSYLTAVAMLVLYLGLSALASKSEFSRTLFAWLDPFGGGAIEKVTRYWTATETNSRLPPVTGVILGNRLIFAALGIAFMALTYRLLRLDVVGVKTAKAVKKAKKEMAAPPVSLSSPVTPRFGFGTAMATLFARTRFEVAQIFSGPVYLILMLLAIALSVLFTFAANQIYGTAIYPVTRVMIASVGSGFSLFAMIVAIFYSGELVWRERGRRIHEIIDSTAIPNWAFLIPKTLALIIVLISTVLMSVVAGMAVQVVKGFPHFELGKYIVWYLLPFSLSVSLIGVLAIFVQALSPNKFAGWAIMVVYLLFTMVAGQFGLNHHLYLYGTSPALLTSDMNGLGHMWIGWLAFKLYWTAFAIALLVVAHLLWRRGAGGSFKGRLSLAGARLKGPAGVILVLAGIAFAALGAFNFYNTNILNTYRTKSQTEKQEVAFEKAFTPVTDLPLPNITDVHLKVDLYPHDLRFVSTGSYVLENRTTRPITKLYLNSPEELKYSRLSLEGAHQAQDWPDYGVRLFVFDKAMAPGDKRVLSFSAEQAQQGFSNDGITTRIVDNGTFLNNAEVAPRVGITNAQIMQDKRLRRKYHLPPLKRMNPLEGPAGLQSNYIGADWTHSDITLSTVADETPIAPGYKVSDVTNGGRRTARFVSEKPILNFFSLLSAHYAEKHVMHDGIDLAVYYDQQHAYNVDDMLHAMTTSLDYYQANFSPYQFRQARILEFPAYDGAFAQSFANTIPYSEGIGFIADIRNPDKIDYPTYVTAHELAHQWWAHQVVGANKEGSESLSETLAQYSALMVMEKLYGPDKIRRFLKYELDTYLRNRQLDSDEEMPLYRVQHQAYIYYNKGSLVMYLLKDRLGADKVNAALRQVLAAHAFKGAPWPTSLDLVNALRAQASPQDQQLITDLFEKITLWDLRATAASVKKRADGKYDVTFTVEAHKYYADGKGKETETPVDESFDIGLFTAQPGEGKFDTRNVIQLTRQNLHSGKQVIRLTVDKAPTYVGVDPYNKWIDRDSDDNVTKVGG